MQRAFGNTGSAETLANQLNSNLSQMGVQAHLPEIPRYAPGGSAAIIPGVVNQYNQMIQSQRMQNYIEAARQVNPQDQALQNMNSFPAVQEYYKQVVLPQALARQQYEQRVQQDAPILNAERARFLSNPEEILGKSNPYVQNNRIRPTMLEADPNVPGSAQSTDAANMAQVPEAALNKLQTLDQLHDYFKTLGGGDAANLEHQKADDNTLQTMTNTGTQLNKDAREQASFPADLQKKILENEQQSIQNNYNTVNNPLKTQEQSLKNKQLHENIFNPNKPLKDRLHALIEFHNQNPGVLTDDDLSRSAAAIISGHQNNRTTDATSNSHKLMKTLSEIDKQIAEQSRAYNQTPETKQAINTLQQRKQQILQQMPSNSFSGPGGFKI
jgi:hypothetical protein